MTESRNNMKLFKQTSRIRGIQLSDGDIRDLDRGWSWVVMMASFGGFCVIGSTMYAVGIIHSTLLERFQERVTITSWAGALHSALIYAGPLTSLVIDRISCRMAMVLSGICYVIGYFCTAFAPNIGVAIFTCGIIAGFGGAFGNTACIMVLGLNFRQYQHIANGIALSGVGVGMFAMAPLMQLSRNYYGTSGFFIILGAISANMVTFGTLCFLSVLEISTKQKRKLKKLKQKEKSLRCAGLRGYAKVLNKPVICLCLCMFNYCLGTFLVYLHLPTYVEYKGFTPVEASYFVSVSGIANVLGRILTGLIANLNKLPDISLYSGSMVIVAIATIIYPYYSDQIIGNIVYSVILGLFVGSCYVLMGKITETYIGINYMSAAVGLQFFFGGGGALFGPVLAGIIVDSRGSYDQSLIVAGIMLHTVVTTVSYEKEVEGLAGSLIALLQNTKNMYPSVYSKYMAESRGGNCRDMDRGWSWVVMMASFGGFCLMGAAMYAVGIIHSTLLERFQESVTITTWAGALHSALIYVGGPLSSLVIDRISCRMAMVLSGVCYVIGYFCTAFAPNIGVAIFTCGIIAGLGGAFGMTACMVVQGFNFRRFQHITNGIAFSGVGVGMFALAPVMQLSRTYYGTSGFFLILAAIYANMITFGTLCFPSALEISTKQGRKMEKLKQKEKSSHCAGLRGYAKILNKPVVCLCLSMLNYCLGTFLVYLHLPTYVASKGFSPVEASYFVSVSGIANVIGRILTGVIANLNKLPDISLYSGSMGIIAIATLIYPLYSDQIIGNIVYSVILGLFVGSCYVVMVNITKTYIGIHYMTAAVGLQLFFGGIGALIGPVLAGILVDSGGSYDQSFYVAGSCIMLASILGVASHCFYRRSSQGTSEIDIVMDTSQNDNPVFTLDSGETS